MEKVSNFISKKVISLDDGNLVGYVLNVLFDENIKNFIGLIVSDEESENTFVLDRGNIATIGIDCVMIDDCLKLEYNISSVSNNPIGKEVYDCFGNMLGRVIDVEIFGKTVKKIITNKCEFPQRLIRKSGDNFIIFGSPKKEKIKKTFAQQIGENSANLLPISYVTISPQNELIEPEGPMRLFANSNSLMGKMVTNEILGLNNELIAKKFDIIDKKIINKARIHNKLNLLAFYSK